MYKRLTKTRELLANLLLPARGHVAGAHPSSSGHKAGTHPGQDALPHHRAHSHTQPHSLRLNTWDTPIHLMRTSWDVGGNHNTWRKPVKIWRERANSTQTSDPEQDSIFSPLIVIMKWCWMACRYSRICCAFTALRTLYSMQWLVGFSLR